MPVFIFADLAGFTALTDPVCRMRLRPGEAAGTLRHTGKAYSFCSLDCARRFAEQPEAYA
jgi:adenylate cyclase